MRDVLGSTAPASEFNVLGELWNARVTSHIPLSRWRRNITAGARSCDALTLADAAHARGRIRQPRIAVAGLNPHAGDGGNFGREEIDIIEPAVAKAQAKGFTVEGPFPSDTVFLRAKNGDFDAVLTMYHDQGQIAMKLMGFDRGVTLIGGFPFPICTPAHGTAYEIAGQRHRQSRRDPRRDAARHQDGDRSRQTRVAQESASAIGGGVPLDQPGYKNKNKKQKITGGSHAQGIVRIVIRRFAVCTGAARPLAADKPVEFVVTSGPGGGTDNFARIVQSIIAKHKLIDQPIVVTNKGGGSGAEGFLYARSRRRSPQLTFGTNNAYLLPSSPSCLQGRTT